LRAWGDIDHRKRSIRGRKEGSLFNVEMEWTGFTKAHLRSAVPNMKSSEGWRWKASHSRLALRIGKMMKRSYFAYSRTHLRLHLATRYSLVATCSSNYTFDVTTISTKSERNSSRKEHPSILIRMNNLANVLSHQTI